VPEAGSKAPEADSTRGVYPMSVATDLTGMHAQTLRKYEREGLLEPSRTTGGSRRFSRDDVGRLRRIGDLADDGVNVEGIRRLLDLENRITGLEARIEGLERALHVATVKGGRRDDRAGRPSALKRSAKKS